jgi:hypothetical protein
MVEAFAISNIDRNSRPTCIYLCSGLEIHLPDFELFRRPALCKLNI